MSVVRYRRRREYRVSPHDLCSALRSLILYIQCVPLNAGSRVDCIVQNNSVFKVLNEFLLLVVVLVLDVSLFYSYQFKPSSFVSSAHPIQIITMILAPPYPQQKYHAWMLPLTSIMASWHASSILSSLQPTSHSSSLCRRYRAISHVQETRLGQGIYSFFFSLFLP
jgi:hypothetical protein